MNDTRDTTITNTNIQNDSGQRMSTDIEKRDYNDLRTCASCTFFSQIPNSIVSLLLLHSLTLLSCSLASSVPALEARFQCFQAAQDQKAEGTNCCERLSSRTGRGADRRRLCAVGAPVGALALIAWKKKIVLTIMKDLFVNPATLLFTGSLSTQRLPADCTEVI